MPLDAQDKSKSDDKLTPFFSILMERNLERGVCHWLPFLSFTMSLAPLNPKNEPNSEIVRYLID